MFPHKGVASTLLALAAITLAIAPRIVYGQTGDENPPGPSGGPAPAVSLPSDPSEWPEPEVPEVSASHRTFLARVVRRTLRDCVRSRPPYAPEYVPEALQNTSAEVVVRLRQRGFLVAAGAAGSAPLTDATRNASLVACQQLGSAGLAGLDAVNALLVELEVVGPLQAIEAQIDWTQPRALDPYVEPGVHGLLLDAPRRRHRFCPTELFTSDMTLAAALDVLAQHILGDPSQVSRTRLYRFRTAHWVQAAPGDEAVSLLRGLTPVPLADANAPTLDAAITELARYMSYRQRPDGLFSYQYEPASDAYSDDDNLVRQIGAAVAMAIDARCSRRSASLAAAEAAIRFHLQGLTDVPGQPDAAFLSTADGQNKLGATALLALALAEHPQPDKYASIRQRLIRAMLWLQRPSGMFVTAFPPAEALNAQDYFPGEALLAMASHHALQPTADVIDAFDQAMEFYRVYFHNVPSPAFVSWQVQAYARMAGHTQRRDYVAYVFELTDWLAARQLTPDNCRYPDLWGGIASYQPGRAGVATAAYLEGFADALRLARAAGDVERAARYEKLVRLAARFVLQLQVRPAETYFVRSPKDAVGGIRTAPALNLLRIDHAQHGLIGLIKAREALFSPPD